MTSFLLLFLYEEKEARVSSIGKSSLETKYIIYVDDKLSYFLLRSTFLLITTLFTAIISWSNKLLLCKYVLQIELKLFISSWHLASRNVKSSRMKLLISFKIENIKIWKESRANIPGGDTLKIYRIFHIQISLDINVRYLKLKDPCNILMFIFHINEWNLILWDFSKLILDRKIVGLWFFLAAMCSGKLSRN